MDKYIQQIDQLAKENPDIKIVWLYGSRARNTAHKNSDYDIAIAFNNFPKDQIDKLQRIQNLQFEWQDITGSKNFISLVDINNIPTYLAFSIINEGKIITNKDDYRLIKEEQRIMQQYEFMNQQAG